MSKRDDLSVDQLKCFVSNETLIEEKRRFFKRFYKNDRVRLRGSTNRVKGTVMRAAVEDEGGLIISWDGDPGRLFLHNPHFIETVWLNDEGEEI